MAEKEKTRVDVEFRRRAALAILGAYVQRHGGFTPEEREAHMRLVWEYADTFVALENAPPLPPPAPPQAAVPRKRAAAPSDEWGVRDGERLRRGFVTRDEAEAYAAGRDGAEVVQLSGPGVVGVLTAPASVDKALAGV